MSDTKTTVPPEPKMCRHCGNTGYRKIFVSADVGFITEACGRCDSFEQRFASKEETDA